MKNLVATDDANGAARQLHESSSSSARSPYPGRPHDHASPPIFSHVARLLPAYVALDAIEEVVEPLSELVGGGVRG